MNKAEVKKLVQNNIDAIEETIDIALLISDKSKELTHYKKIDGRYLGQLEKVIPVTSTYYNKWKKEEVEIKNYSLRQGRYNQKDIVLSVNKTNDDGGYTIDDRSNRYYQDYYINLRSKEEETTPQNFPQEIAEFINRKGEELQNIKTEFSNIDIIVSRHNRAVDQLTDLKKLNDEVSYTIRKCMPEVKIPFVYTRDKVSD